MLTVMFASSFLGMIVSTAIVTKSDPTDPTIALIRDMDQRLRDENNNRITRIAQFYCNLCETNVMKYTKHCALCNRCCFEFDHHCRWVNNDIGRMNYIQFMRMLLWVLMTLVLSIILSILALIFTKKSEETEGQTLYNSSVLTES